MSLGLGNRVKAEEESWQQYLIQEKRQDTYFYSSEASSGSRTVYVINMAKTRSRNMVTLHIVDVYGCLRFLLCSSSPATANRR